MFLKRLSLLAILLGVMSAGAIQAATNDISVDENPDIGALFPVLGNVITGKADGKQFVSVANQIGESFKAGNNPTFTQVASSFVEWSYNRGVGSIPNTCADGTTMNAGLCAKDCPAGYSSVAGVCWQHCPSGYTDMGATCTKWEWWPKTIAKNSWVQERTMPFCPEGTVNEAGLCYTPCADTFNPVGPICFGRFGGAVDQARIREQAEAQQQAALGSAGAGGIAIPEGTAPKLKTDMAFAPIVCSLANTQGAFGLPLPGADEVGGMAVDGIGDAIVNKISESAADTKAWFVPSISDSVVFDFAMDMDCQDDGVKAVASLNMKPSVTVKASTKMFDSALHNLAGVDLGVMSVSVYELIPFRVYGTVGSTMSADSTLSSTIDRSQPAVIIDGQQYANSTKLDVTPGMELWLSAEAYIRITSILSFIPDLLQLGAEFKLWILELAMPYSLEEGVAVNASGAEVYKTESLQSNLSSGRGYVDTFLRVFGIETNAFGDDADLAWEGYKEDKVIFNRTERQPVEAGVIDLINSAP